MTFDTVAADPSVAAPLPAPDAPEGADWLVEAAPHDEALWDAHPDVERYRVEMKTGQDHADRWSVLVWLKPDPGQAPVRLEPGVDVPGRPADAEFILHSAYDQEFFGRHPDILAWRSTLMLNDAASGAVRKIEVWTREPAAAPAV